MLNDVGSDRIVAAMGQLGARCGILGPAGSFAGRSWFADRLFLLPALGGHWGRSLFIPSRLERIARDWRPDIVIPLDDFSARALRDPRLHRAASASVRTLIERSLGAPAGFETACGRQAFIEMAAALGVATPDQRVARDREAAREAAASLGYPVVLKRDQTCGGFGVTVVREEAALASAFRGARLKARRKQALRWLFGFGTTDDAPLVLQRFVPGPLAFRTAACRDGVVLDAVSFVAECIHPAVTGASTVLRPIDHAGMEAAVITLVAALKCSGLVSFDFLLPPDGSAVVIEMNPRPVVSGHLGRLFGHDIYRALLEGIGDTVAARAPCEVAAPDSTAPDLIALFPRELDRDPRGAILETSARVYHDVPWDDAGIVPIYADWLERRHPEDRQRIARRLRGAERRGERDHRPQAEEGVALALDGFLRARQG